MLDVGNANDKIVKVSEESFSPNEDCILKLTKINHFKGVEFSEALALKKSTSGAFYLDKNEKFPVLIYQKSDKVIIILIIIDN